MKSLPLPYVLLSPPLSLAGHPIGATGLAQCAEINWQVKRNSKMDYVFTSHVDHAKAVEHIVQGLFPRVLSRLINGVVASVFR